MTPDLNLLPTLLVLLEEKQVTLAAKKLCVSQPAVSKRLALLRETLHDPLLVRIDGNYERTSFADSLYPQLKDLFNRAESLFHPVVFHPESDTFFVDFAIHDFSSQVGIPFILSSMASLCPGMNIRVHLWQRANFRELHLGEIHCAKSHISPAELTPGFHFIPLAERSAKCLMRKDHPLAHGELTLEDYIAAKHICYVYDGCVNWLDKTLSQQGLQRKITMCYPSVRGCCAIVRDTDLLLTASHEISEAYCEEFNLVSLPVPAACPTISESLIWHDHFDADPAQRWFRQTFLLLYTSMKNKKI